MNNLNFIFYIIINFKWILYLNVDCKFIIILENKWKSFMIWIMCYVYLISFYWGNLDKGYIGIFVLNFLWVLIFFKEKV